MTWETTVGGSGPPRDVLAEAMELYTVAAELFSENLRELRAGDRAKATKELGELTREYRKTLQSVLTERAAVDRLRREVAGAAAGAGGDVRGAVLDFDAARDEIGRRLARLRDAGGGG